MARTRRGAASSGLVQPGDEERGSGEESATRSTGLAAAAPATSGEPSSGQTAEALHRPQVDAAEPPAPAVARVATGSAGPHERVSLPKTPRETPRATSGEGSEGEQGAGGAPTAPGSTGTAQRPAPTRAQERRATPSRATAAGRAGEGAPGAHRTVSKLLVSTHELLTSTRKATGRTNTALALLAIDHQAAHLAHLLQESRSPRRGSLFKDLPAEVERRVRVTLDFTPAQVEVIDELAKQHGTTRQQLIDVAVAAEYGTAQG